MSSILAKTDLPARPGRPGGSRTAALLASLVRRALPRVPRRPEPPLTLEMTRRSVHFRGLADFDFALRSRTEFPAHRVRDVVACTPERLEAAAARVREADRLLSGILIAPLDEPGLTGEMLREVDPRVFSEDHGWRDIMEALTRLSPAHDGYKRIALVRYVQYLRARQVILRSAFIEKTRDDDRACLHATPALPARPADDHGETELFPAGTSCTLEAGYRALPKAETVEVTLTGPRHMELLLAGNHMRLYTGRECYLVDDGNSTYPLRAGRNLVGRHRACDVVVDPACRSISRRHLVIECLADDRVRLTDLSTHGTEIAAGRNAEG